MFFCSCLKLVEAKSAEYESRFTSQQSGTLHTGVELDHLKSRVETLESEKRDALAAHERKVTELDQLNEDYRNLMNSHQEIKKEASKNETEAREARSSEMSHKVREHLRGNKCANQILRMMLIFLVCTIHHSFNNKLLNKNWICSSSVSSGPSQN